MFSPSFTCCFLSPPIFTMVHLCIIQFHVLDASGTAIRLSAKMSTDCFSNSVRHAVSTLLNELYVGTIQSSESWFRHVDSRENDNNCERRSINFEIRYWVHEVLGHSWQHRSHENITTLVKRRQPYTRQPSILQSCRHFTWTYFVSMVLFHVFMKAIAKKPRFSSLVLDSRYMRWLDGTEYNLLLCWLRL